MILKCSDYAGSKAKSLTIMKSKGPACIPELAALMGVPIGVLLTWYKNHIEDSEFIRQRIKDIVDFYQYTEIEEDS
jgi:uncharacterized membrane protein